MQSSQQKVVIISQSFAATREADELRGVVPTVRVASSSSTADIIFPQGVSVAFKVVSADQVVAVVEEINSFQASFQNCVLVIVECPRNEEANVDQLQSWQDGLMALSLGSLRFAFVRSTRDVVRTVLKVRSSMSQPQKLALQKQYFRQQLDALVSSSTARSVLTEALARMAIPEAEQELLIDAYGSIEALMLAEEESILQNCPVCAETAGRVVAFFSRSTAQEMTSTDVDHDIF